MRRFDEELADLGAALSIPGLAYVVVEHGELLAQGTTPTHAGEQIAPGDSPALGLQSPLRIASVTKALSAVLILQLAEQGLLSLDDSLAQHLTQVDGMDREQLESVQVRHLLTHSSEGLIGEEYVYGTQRFALLGDLVAAVTGSSFEQVLRRQVIEPAGMDWHQSPYLGAHAGLVSTVSDMGRFLAALDRGLLLNEESSLRLQTPSRSNSGRDLPLSLGWFLAEVQGQPVHWSFGQDDPEHSGALLLRLPQRGLSLFLMADRNVLSDPFRLLMGDVSKSPFAMAFLRLFAFSPPGQPLKRPDRASSDLLAELAVLEETSSYRFDQELMAWLMVDLWNQQAAQVLDTLQVLEQRGALWQRPDPVLHFALMQLSSAGVGSPYRERALAMGRELLAQHPNNRWILMAQGDLAFDSEQAAEVRRCFQAILELPNQQPDHLHRLFQAWSHTALARLVLQTDPQEARRRLQLVVDSRVGGGTQQQAQDLLEQIENDSGENVARPEPR